MSMRVANARHVISRTTSDLVVRPLRAPQWMPERSAQPRISSMRIAFRTVCAHSGQYVQGMMRCRLLSSDPDLGGPRGQSSAIVREIKPGLASIGTH